MKKYFIQFTVAAMAILTLGLSNNASAQCNNDNNLWQTGPTVTSGTYTIFGQWGGEYSTIGVVSGTTYTISTCGGASYDTQITLYNNAGGGALAYNDDFCGLQSQVTWTATFTGTLRILTDQYFCAAGVNFTSTTITINAVGGGVNPCASITNLTCSANTGTFSLVGSGAWTLGPWSSIGAEQVYSFTAPSTGTYNIAVTNNGSYYVDLFQGTSCGAASWTYLNDIFSGSTEVSAVALTGGVTYYFLIDDEDTAPSSGSILITCPASNCNDFSFTGPFSHSSTTVGAGNDCSLRGSEDRTYKITLNTAGCYTFSMCGTSPNWDSYMYLTTACCGGATLASDDDGCGGIGVSTINNISLAAGTYYLTIEGFSTFGAGSYTLNVTAGAPPSPGTITGPASFCCGGQATFSVPFVSGVTYNWTTTNGTIAFGQGSSSVTIDWGTGSGVVSVTASNSCGTSAASSTSATCTPGSANDDCSLATVVGGSFFGSNLCATGSISSSGCGFSDTRDVWYAYTAPSCGQLTVNTCSPDRTFDTQLALWTGCGGSQIVCNDDNCGLGSSVTANVQAGVTYLIRLSGFNGQTGTTTVNVSMSAPLAASASATSSYSCGFNVSCNGATNGSAAVTATGGIAPVSYAWSNGGTGSSISGVGAGTYSVTVTDGAGCSVVASATLTEPATLTNQILDAHSPPYSCGFNISCNGAADGAVLADAAGGCAPYTYLWSNGATTGIVNNLPAGGISVTVTDANGCSVVSSYTLTQPDPVSGSATLSTYNCGYNVSCNGGNDGSIDQSVSGGCAPYFYFWSNGASSEDLSGLSAGTYSVTVIDQNGCTITQSYTLTQPAAVTVSCPSNVTVFPGYGPAACATLTATGIGGGCAPYSISWSNGGNTASINVCPAVTTVYTVTVTDANGCTASCSVTVCAINVAYGNNQVTICHIPPGNPNAQNTLNVGSGSVATHLAHGDYLGACGVGNQPCASLKTDDNASNGAEAELASGTLEAYPNPFSTTTTLSFRFESNEHVTVNVYNLTGSLVANLFEGDVTAGSTNKVDFNIGSVAEGVYVARLVTTSGQVMSRRLVVVR